MTQTDVAALVFSPTRPDAAFPIWSVRCPKHENGLVERFP